MFSNDLRNRMRIALGTATARDELEALLSIGSPYATHWYVNADTGSNTAKDGRSPASPFKTMEKAFSRIAAGDVIHLRGPIFENLTAPAVAGVTILGDGTGLRHGSLSNASEGYAPAWRTGSGVTDEPLCIVSCQGWTFLGILMAPPTAEYGIQFKTRSGDTPEKTVSGGRVLLCRFAGGAGAIMDNGGAGLLSIRGNRFEKQTDESIGNSNGESLPLMWEIEDNKFVYGSASHIIAPLVSSVIQRNVFGKVASTAKYIDLTGGSDNDVTDNSLAGLYDTTDYVAGTGDRWYGNRAVTGEATVGDNGLTIDVPAA